jgi:hypothetical protein
MADNKPFDSFVEHQRKAFEEASKAIDALIPPDFKEHSRTAINESLEGFRVLVNSFVDEVKTQVNDMGGSESTSKGKVKVEVE